LDYIEKIWPFPRIRGKLNLIESFRFYRELRLHKFDISIDFEGNDRGAISSRIVNANLRVGAVRKSSSIFQKSSYSVVVKTDLLPPSYIIQNKNIIQKGLGFKFRQKLPAMQILPNSSIVDLSVKIIPGKFIICHVSSTQSKKQWSIDNWSNLFILTKKIQIPLFFSAGPSSAEQFFLFQLKKINPDINILKPIYDIKDYIGLLSRASLLISNDSGPLHFAAAMQVNVIGLFGPSDSVKRAAPIYSNEQKLLGKKCECINDLGRKHFCSAKIRCIDTINPIEVFNLLEKQIKKAKNFK
jgi:ADP-heptose:LPS heptosyltransferase